MKPTLTSMLALLFCLLSLPSAQAQVPWSPDSTPLAEHTTDATRASARALESFDEEDPSTWETLIEPELGIFRELDYASADESGEQVQHSEWIHPSDRKAFFGALRNFFADDCEGNICIKGGGCHGATYYYFRPRGDGAQILAGIFEGEGSLSEPADQLQDEAIEAAFDAVDAAFRLRAQPDFERARTLLEFGESRAAIAKLQSALQKDPLFYEARFELIRALVAQNNLDDATEAMKKFRDTTAPEALQFLQTIDRDPALASLKRHPNARESLREVTAAVPREYETIIAYLSRFHGVDDRVDALVSPRGLWTTRCAEVDQEMKCLPLDRFEGDAAIAQLEAIGERLDPDRVEETNTPHVWMYYDMGEVYYVVFNQEPNAPQYVELITEGHSTFEHSAAQIKALTALQKNLRSLEN